MGGLEKYYDKESLMECIRLNAQFLEMSCSLGKKEDYQLSQYAELQYLISEWDRRRYSRPTMVDWAVEILHSYDENVLHACCE